MRVFRRPRDSYNDPAATDFIWGVPRREGHSDTDDPGAHSGVVQHAFEFGRDDRAICGFEPPKRTSRAYREARPQLAVPGRDNPKCRKCELLVVSRVRGDEAVPVMDDAAGDDGDPTGAPAELPDDPTDEALPAGEAEGTRDSAEEALAAADEPREQVTPREDRDSAIESQEPPEEPLQEYDEQPAEPYQVAGARHQLTDDTLGEPADSVDGMGGIRDPGFQPRGAGERARRRSVRRGGTVLVGPGRRTVVIEVPLSTGVAGIVANVEPEIQDVRVEAVTVGNDGTARVTLNRPAPQAVEVAWYIVSNPFRETA